MEIFKNKKRDRIKHEQKNNFFNMCNGDLGNYMP